MPSYFPEGNRSLPSDNYLRSLQKMVSLDGGDGGGESGGASPSMNNLVAWYKTDTLALSDGAAVSSWPDSSANGNTLTQGTGSKQPTFKTGVLQSRNAVRFSSTNDTCLIDTTPTGFAGGTGLTIYAVVKAITWSTWGEVVVTNSGVNELRLTNTQAVYNFFMNGTEVLLGTSEGTGPWAARIFRGRFSDSGDVMGVKVTGFSENTLANAGTFVSNQICLGARDNADTTLNLDGDIGEVLIYSADLSGADLTQTESYLAGRWGLAV